MALYPLLLEPIYKEKVWGGRTLECLGRSLPGAPDARIGESWELADLDETSPTGGGGEPARSRIRNGPLIERTLSDVIADFGAMVTGSVELMEGGRFPLLLKYLDARENLSVQVHPSPRYAAAHPEAHLKSEAWYVLHAEPDAVIYKGVVAGTSREAFEAAVRDGSVVDLLVRVPARPGSCHYLPSGSCHALGGGVLVAEVQTPSDTTFRVFDWGRTDRALQLEAALECIDYRPVDAAVNEPGTTESEGGVAVRHLVACEHFSVFELGMSSGREHRFDSREMSVLMIVEGGGRMRWGREGPRVLDVGGGDTVLLPAALSEAVLEARSDLKLLQVTLPHRGNP